MALLGGGALVAVLLVWQALTAAGNPNPLASSAGQSAAVFDIGVLVFREGLECVLVLAAISAGITARRRSAGRPIAFGAAAGFVATLVTWLLVVRIVTDLGQSVSALALQAATGLLAVVVLLVVMNWFFHKLYWTGWISLHSRRGQELLDHAAFRSSRRTRARVLWGLALLGFTSFYREGFEVVLFLQGYRLRLGDGPVLWGVCIGVFLAAIVAVFTFVAHRRLPYRRMLVLTGMLLGLVLVVMVGEQAQEMQLAHWLSTTPIPHLAPLCPGWLGLWFSVFPTVETLLAQGLAVLLVVGSYFVANRSRRPRASD